MSTQDVEYDGEGNEIVSGYDIDTSGSQDGSKTFNGDGVNTEFYAFDVTRGFTLHMHFTIDFKQQPAGQDENHHNILTMKRATPEPWYGFQFRHSSTNKNIIVGTQFSSGGNTNTTINPHWITSNVLGEYDLQIVYDPTAATNNFVCRDLIGGSTVYQATKLFPDLPELRYLSVCIGYALDANGNPYRYSNINVSEFTLEKLPAVTEPVISCQHNLVTMTCTTQGATIHYRVGNTGNFLTYGNPILISEDTVFQAYAQLDYHVSSTVTQTCLFDNNIDAPTIDCDGELVTIMCETPSVDLWYRLGQSGEYSLYDSPIEIFQDTVVQAYAELNGATSQVVTESCTTELEVIPNTQQH